MKKLIVSVFICVLFVQMGWAGIVMSFDHVESAMPMADYRDSRLLVREYGIRDINIFDKELRAAELDQLFYKVKRNTEKDLLPHRDPVLGISGHAGPSETRTGLSLPGLMRRPKDLPTSMRMFSVLNSWIKHPFAQLTQSPVQPTWLIHLEQTTKFGSAELWAYATKHGSLFDITTQTEGRNLQIQWVRTLTDYLPALRETVRFTKRLIRK